MARIQEYNPETEAQGPVGQLSPLLDQVTMFGRGMEAFGNDVTTTLKGVEQRETQAETSDAYASAAEQRAGMMVRIQQETNDGTLDVNKVTKDYQDWADKTADTYSTAGGRNAFNRAATRAGGSILQTAARGQVVVAGARAKSNLSTLMNANSNMVMNDPSQFPDLREAQVEAIQEQVQAGAISQPIAAQMQTAMDLELSKGAVRGIIQMDYDQIKKAVIASGGKIDPETMGINGAKKMLDEGHFDDYMDSTTKKSMVGEIRQNQAAAQTAGLQYLAQQKEAKKAMGEAFKGRSYEKLLDNSLSPDEVTKAFQRGDIDSDDQLKMYHLIEQVGKSESKTNPTIKNNIMERVLSPDNSPDHISDPMQVAYMVQSGMLTPNDFQDVKTAIQMVPTNRVNSFNESKLIQQAKQKIGTNDPDAAYKLMMFTNEIQQAKKAAVAQQKPIDGLLDPNSSEYLGNQIVKYVASPQELLRQQAAKARGQMVVPAPIQTMPGVTPTPSEPSMFGGIVQSAKNYFTGGGESAPSGPKPEDIAAMKLEDLGKLNPGSLTPAQREAARVRYNSLNKPKYGGKK